MNPELYLNTTQTVLTWVHVDETLPEIPEGEDSVRVIAWWPNAFQYVPLTYRRVNHRKGGPFERFEYQGRISHFPVEFWAIPIPPNILQY